MVISTETPLTAAENDLIATVGRYCNPDVEVYTRKQSIKVTVAGYWEGGRDNGSRAAARELSVDLRHHLLCG